MLPFRYRNEPPYIYADEEEESSSRSALYIALGAAAGFAAGVLMAERFGGFQGLTERIKDTFGGGGETDEGMCPACGAYQWAHGAHHQGCRLAAALAAIRALLPDVDGEGGRQ